MHDVGNECTPAPGISWIICIEFLGHESEIRMALMKVERSI